MGQIRHRTETLANVTVTLVEEDCHIFYPVIYPWGINSAQLSRVCGVNSGATTRAD